MCAESKYTAFRTWYYWGHCLVLFLCGSIYKAVLALLVCNNVPFWIHKGIADCNSSYIGWNLHLRKHIVVIIFFCYNCSIKLIDIIFFMHLYIMYVWRGGNSILVYKYAKYFWAQQCQFYLKTAFQLSWLSCMFWISFIDWSGR